MRWETNKAEGFIGAGRWREGDAATKRNCKLQQLSLSLSLLFLKIRLCLVICLDLSLLGLNP
jgi:hypothetical protein